MDVVAVILAAGKGKRMHSRLPKVLHRVAGKPMIEHVLAAVRGAGVGQCFIVIGHGAEEVKQQLGSAWSYVYQEEQLGTGHAVAQVKPVWPPEATTMLVLCGDTPLLRPQTLKLLLEEHSRQRAAATVLTACLEDPSGYGRIVRDAFGRVTRIVEEKDATESERAIKEINTGIYCFSTPSLWSALERIKPDNAQGEYYLTDVLAILEASGQEIAAVACPDAEEIMGVNDRLQLAEAETAMRRRINNRHMRRGVTIIHPASTFIDADVEIGQDSVIYPFTFLEGNTVVGPNCSLGPGLRLVNSRLGEGVVASQSVIVESKVGDRCHIGPFAYLRPGTVLASDVKVGDFVELKATTVGRGSKIPHLSYLGDTTVGEEVNIGAGTITCNYDGRRKWPTVIGDGAFIGSNTNLVAPVTVGAGAVVGAGSTITQDVPEAALAVGRARQVNLPNRAKKFLLKQEEDEKGRKKNGQPI
ncbi:MAG: bifunctional UDP-N-acetylglucosamine pyrophosphorylase / glucosamine-phosphate N-acetyltransferase [Clostridia bacterium]|nr:bifunctional UDP-N-acetylglucosamine pyrophosphorylase / glucosamine-phosphate N-acetyltransferase [Clostridia bacterium]